MITAINCPQCNIDINVNDWLYAFAKTTDGLYYFTCKGCKTKLGSTLTHVGTLSIWVKEKEMK